MMCEECHCPKGQDLKQTGLRWTRWSGISVPKWTKEPDIDAVSSVVGSVLNPGGGSLAVEFFGHGTFNKAYHVSFQGQSYLMRVTLPVDPFYKTLGEVATIMHVKKHTDIPVPHIVAFDAATDNLIGYEWILMEKLPGEPVNNVWGHYSPTVKEDFVCKMADYIGQLWNLTMSARGVGSLYPAGVTPATPRETLNAIFGLPRLLDAKPDRVSAPGPSVGRICARSFFWEDKIKLNIPRGPFKCGRDWMFAELALVEQHANMTLESPATKCPNPDLWHSINRLRGHIFNFFPPELDFLEDFAISHGDLAARNILADEAGTITGIVDWEFVYASPTSAHHLHLPDFLDTGMQLPGAKTPEPTEPRRRRRRRRALDSSCVSISDSEPQPQSPPCKPTYSTLMQHDMLRLRRVFRARLARVCPQWKYDSQDKRCAMQRDFVRVVGTLCFDGRSNLAEINEWLDAFEGKNRSPEKKSYDEIRAEIEELWAEGEAWGEECTVALDEEEDRVWESYVPLSRFIKPWWMEACG